MSREGKLAFVPPRYGDDVVGGAEMVLAEMAHGLSRRGWEVEVLTTCARDHFEWTNVYPQGDDKVDGVTVRRFPTAVHHDRGLRQDLEGRIMSGAHVSLDEQDLWANAWLRVPELFHYILDNHRDYRAMVFAPYPFWTTYACSQIAPDRTILMPCLHDEPYAHLEIFKPVFEGPAGMWFLSQPEMDLAGSIFDLPKTSELIGSGISQPSSYDPDGFRARHGITSPFVLYAGRREGGKGWERLLSDFEVAVSGGVSLDLVTSGVGEVHLPAGLKGRIHDLGFLSPEELAHAFAAASAYVQPSALESFSRTIMEAWLAGTLVIVNGESPVTSWHCERSGAGLIYRGTAQLVECLRFVSEAPDKGERIASKGRSYVEEHYTWPRVLDAAERTIEEWL